MSSEWFAQIISPLLGLRFEEALLGSMAAVGGWLTLLPCALVG
jgi:hypothetical protein